MSPKQTAVAIVTMLLAIAALNQCKRRDDVYRMRHAGAPPGQYLGYASVDKIIRDRILDLTEMSNLSYQVHRSGGYAVSSLSELLGGFSIQGERRNYFNGDPNPLSLLLWHSILVSFAESLGQYCALPEGQRVIAVKSYSPEEIALPESARSSTHVSLVVSTSFDEKIRKVCRLNSEDADQKKRDLEAFWYTLISYETPESEFDIWYKHFYQSVDTVTADVLTESLIGLFLNPNFLLSKG